MTLRQEHLEHLRTSGLTDETIEAAKITTIDDPAIAQQLMGFAAPTPAIGFPIWGIDKKRHKYQMRPDKPHVNEKGKPVKYVSPRGKSPAINFPPMIDSAAWVNVGVDLWITEGVKKSLALAQLGIACVSVQGVWMAHDIKTKRETGQRKLHEELRALPLEGRTVIICFDGGDTTENEGVMNAEKFLARLLTEAGAKVKLARVPYTNGGPKIGIDDYLLTQSDKKAAIASLPMESYVEEPERTTADFMAAKKLNDRFAFVATQNKVYDKETGEWLTLSGLANSKYIGATTWVDQEFRMERTSFMKVDFAPGRDLDNETLNTFDRNRMVQDTGNPIFPESCPPDLWADVMNLTEDNIEQANYLLDRLAYTLRHPDRPMTGLILQGPRGTGKSSYTDLACACVSPYAQVVSQTRLQGQFNDWLARAILVVIPEGNADKLTDQHATEMYLSEFALAGTPVMINQKNVQPYQITSSASFIICTNYEKAIPLAQDDRRWNVIKSERVMKDIPGGVELGKRLWEAKSDKGFIQQMANHLWTRDLSKFEPLKIWNTEARREMVAASRSPIQVFWDLVRSKESPLPAGRLPNTIIYSIYKEWTIRNGHKYLANNTFGRSIPKEWRRATTDGSKVVEIPDFGQPVPSGWEPLDGLFQPTDGKPVPTDGTTDGKNSVAVRPQTPISKLVPDPTDGTDGKTLSRSEEEKKVVITDRIYQNGKLPSVPSVPSVGVHGAPLGACPRCGSTTSCWAMGCRPSVAAGLTQHGVAPDVQPTGER